MFGHAKAERTEYTPKRVHQTHLSRLVLVPEFGISLLGPSLKSSSGFEKNQ
jgi:hypothetical protein